MDNSAAGIYVRCIETVGAVDAGCHRLAEQSVGGNGRRRHCPHRSNFLNDRLTPATFDYHTFNYYLNVTFLPFLEVALTSTAFMNERSHGLRQRGPFGFGPRAAARGTPESAIAVGSTDLFTSSDGGRFSTSGGEGNQYFGSTYVALSKHFVFSGHRFGVHLALTCR